LAVVQIDVQNAAEAAAAIESLRKVEAIASVRLVELEKA
jgi:D-3-phosphoglycerate dehydrogenase